MSDEEDYSSGDVSQAGSGSSSLSTLDHIQSYSTVGQQAISKVAQTIIALNNNKVTITTENVKKIAWDDTARMSHLKFRDVFDTACAYLDTCLGYNLVELPKKKIFTTKGTRESTTTGYVLINSLDDAKAKYVLEKYALDQSKKLYESELNDERGDYKGDKDIFPSLNSDEKLMNNGLILLIISIIILSENSINQEELIKILTNIYGITEVTKFSISQKTILEFLKDLDKQEYVYRKVTKGGQNDDVVEYSLGRRGREEFNKDSFIDFARIIMDEREENPEFFKIVNTSIEAAYK